jgi:hypothetical protein
MTKSMYRSIDELLDSYRCGIHNAMLYVRALERDFDVSRSRPGRRWPWACAVYSVTPLIERRPPVSKQQITHSPFHHPTKPAHT